MKNNKRKSIRKKKLRNERIEKYHQDLLYKEARIDPQTIQGQSKLPINELQPNINNKENYLKKIINKFF